MHPTSLTNNRPAGGLRVRVSSEAVTQNTEEGRSTPAFTKLNVKEARETTAALLQL